MSDYIECDECGETYHRKCDHDCPGPALRRWEVERMIEGTILEERRRTERTLRTVAQAFTDERRTTLSQIANAFAVEDDDSASP